MEKEITQLVEIAKESLKLQKEMLEKIKETNLVIRQMNVYLDKIPG